MTTHRPSQTGPGAIVGRLRSHRHAAALASPRGFSVTPKWGFGKPNRESLEASASLLPKPLGRLGGLELRLAERPRDVKYAQRLRYRVFFEEMSAVADPIAKLWRRDMDLFDAVCDHLVVTDHAAQGSSLAATLLSGMKGFAVDGPASVVPLKPKPAVVGTYRLLRQSVADRAFGFYTANEFGIDPLIARHRHLNFLELGRSCVLKPYRDKRTVELLWQGIWTYVQAHKIDVMIGCASLEGVDPEALRLPLSYLHHYHAAPAEWAAGALPERKASFDIMAKEEIDLRAALRALPPLIKAYLRLGAYVGDGAVVDRDFGTTDVLIILPKTAINPKYVDYYGGEAEPRAA